MPKRQLLITKGSPLQLQWLRLFLLLVMTSVQKELRAGLAAQKIELEVTASSLKSEMNALKRATTNRLGN